MFTANIVSCVTSFESLEENNGKGSLIFGFTGSLLLPVGFLWL